MPETQAIPELPGILRTIVARKREELASAPTTIGQLEKAAVAARPARDFLGALARSDRVTLIAEVKRKSPGAGEIRSGLSPSRLAGVYEGGGASALSVLTDRDFFGGSLADLEEARAATALPALRKDFTLDRYHLFEARAAGADAVLLIVRILDDATLRTLHREAEALGMAVLVEAHDEVEVERALRAGARIVGINNRDLSTFTTRLETTLELMGGVPDDVVVVSESGIRSRRDVERLAEAGVDAILVGETLLRATSPGHAARELASVPRLARPS